MNVRQLEVFQAVMATGSVTRAGALLRISQPAVSQLIGQLERSCGFPLFSRRGSKIEPTREAEALYTEVQRMFVGVGRVARVATALKDRSWGALRIAAFPVMARRVLPSIVTRFCDDRPDARFHVESMRSRSVIDAVATQHIDVGFSVLPGDRAEVESIHLYRVKGVCILPSDHRLASQRVIHARDLAGERFISLGPQDHSRFMIDRIFEDLRISRRMQIETGQSETTYSFVANGAGVAVVDPISVYNYSDSRVAIRAFEPIVEFDIWLIRPKTARSFGLVESFVSYALSELDLFKSREIDKIDAE
ncbi:MAG: LysR family transcriptional regulator [Microvirga sp.]|jgi:DNA-binding transcriptional LysR family regulator|nr:LysR family transcriptional regulator [Microvirga sp.]